MGLNHETRRHLEALPPPRPGRSLGIAVGREVVAGAPLIQTTRHTSTATATAAPSPRRCTTGSWGPHAFYHNCSLPVVRPNHEAIYGPRADRPQVGWWEPACRHGRGEEGKQWHVAPLYACVCAARACTT